MASISKDGSRRAKYLMLTQGGSDKKEVSGVMHCSASGRGVGKFH